MTKEPTTEEFIKALTEALLPLVMEAVQGKRSGSFEIHYFQGTYQRGTRKENF